MQRIKAIAPDSYRRHFIHGEDRIWAETNCYTDVIIELLHGLGHEPAAGLAFTLAIDFEGDQWTFFKFPDGDLVELYGLDIQELAVWRPMVDHIAEQVAAGNPVLVELDSYFLPDTAGSAYQLAHVKSTVAVNEIDVDDRHLGYFHNQGYYHLAGKDFEDVFQLGGLVHERMLPPYVEFVKQAPLLAPAGRAEFLARAEAQLRRHVARMPSRNPFPLFRARFERDLEWLMTADMAAFHTYSFATLRQYGACFELAGTYLAWLQREAGLDLDAPARACLDIAETAKAFQFQLARAMARKKPLDLTPLDAMAACWDAAAGALRQRAG